MTPLDGKYQNLQMSPTYFALALTVSEISFFFIFGLQILGQGHGVQFSQLHHSMANVKIYKRLAHICALSSTFPGK